MSGSLDSDGLLNKPSRRQLALLKSLAAQFHGNGLATIVALRPNTENVLRNESLRNAISDLDFETGAFVAVPITEGITSEEPLLLFVSPEGHVVKAWRGGASAAELGIAVRQALGNPEYSQISEER